MNIRLETNKKYSEDDITKIILNNKPNISNISIKWILFDLEKRNIISKVGNKQYKSNARKYNYEFESNISLELNEWLINKYKNINFIIWETRLLNEWLNQQLAKNIVVIEIEKEYEDIVFFDLISYFPSYMFLLNPNNDLISKYISRDLVIVKTMYSRSPIKKKTHKITLEKLIVDIIADNNLSGMLDTNSVIDIIKGIEDNYDINSSKVLTYSKRRRCLEKLINHGVTISD